MVPLWDLNPKIDCCWRMKQNCHIQVSRLFKLTLETNRHGDACSLYGRSNDCDPTKAPTDSWPTCW